jgi:dolichol-phosphate mannosyltransferase
MNKNKKPIAVVVIPTYNESKTIGKMIDEICQKVSPRINNWHLLVLIVDDTSPDKTFEVVKRKQRKYKNLHLLINPNKAGIGNAYVKGFLHAMTTLKADAVIEIDGDFQHPPESIIELLKRIDHGADYVLGSRRIPGGTMPKGWGVKRIVLSVLGGFIAKTIMFFPSKNFSQITDPTTGLKASRVKNFVERINLENLHSLQFAYKIEFLFQMVVLKANVQEIPLNFQLRQAGESKIDANTAFDMLRTAFKLRLSNPFLSNKKISLDTKPELSFSIK